MNKKAFSTPQAPQAIGPYSQSIESNGFLFLSGQIPLDPKTGTVAATTIMEQTKQVIQNIEAILKARGLSLEHIVKTTLFLKNMSDFQMVNEVYASYFKQTPPARSTVEIAKLPKDVLIEIEAIATLN